MRKCSVQKKQNQTLYCDGVFGPLCFACDVRDGEFSLLVRFYNKFVQNYCNFFPSDECECVDANNVLSI